MFNGASQAIQGSPAVPPVYGLLVAAPTEIMDDTTAAGFRYLPELTNVANAVGAIPVDCIGDTATGMTRADASSNVEQFPFGIFASDSCSARGYKQADYAGRAMRLLDATQSYSIAKELWDGAINAAATLNNRNLNDTASDEMTTSAVAPGDAMALLEQGIAFYGKGRRGMIHVTPQVLYEPGALNYLRNVNGLWLTPMGNIVVADAGYSGSAPGGGAASTTQWGYATEVLEVVLGPVMPLPSWDPVTEEAQWFTEALDRTVNKVTAYAARMAAIKWDRQIHVAAQINLAVPTYGGN